MSTKIFLIDLRGGSPRPFLSEFVNVDLPHWSPDAKYLLVNGSRKIEAPDWWVAPVDGGPAVSTGVREYLRKYDLLDALPCAWLADGNYIVFAADMGDSRNLWRLSLSSKTFQPADPPQRLTFSPGKDFFASVAGNRLAFWHMDFDVQVWNLPVNTNEGKVTGEARRLTEGP